MKKLLFLVSLLAMSATSNAQISEGKDIGCDLSVAPKLFTYGGKSFMLTVTGDDAARTVDVYNDDIEKVRSFQIELPAYTYGNKAIGRKGIEIEDHKIVYTGEWETINDETHLSYGSLTWLSFLNYDSDSKYPDEGFIFTQTLFNTDEKFEYLLPIYGEPQEFVRSESDRDNDGEIDYRYITCQTPLKGVRVVSEDGTVLQSVEWEYTFESLRVGIRKINDKIYLVRGAYAGYYTFYRIDPTSSSIRKVNDVPVSVVARYSVDGRRQKHPRRGVNILRYSDGTAVKVVEK